jgi:hypothetical protein
MDQTNDRDAEIAATITAYVAAANRGDHFDLDDLDPELRNEVEDLLPIVLGAADDDDTTEGWETSAADADEAAARFGFAPRDGTRRILGARLRELRIRSDRTPRHVAAAVSAAGATVTETDITSFENQTIAHVPDRAAAALIDLFGPAVAYGNDDAPGRASANTTESADVSAIVNWVRPDAEIAVLEVGTRSGLPVDEELNINLLGLEAHALVCSSINDVDAVALAATAAAARLFERQPQLNAVFVVAGDGPPPRSSPSTSAPPAARMGPGRRAARRRSSTSKIRCGASSRRSCPTGPTSKWAATTATLPPSTPSSSRRPVARSRGRSSPARASPPNRTRSPASPTKTPPASPIFSKPFTAASSSEAAPSGRGSTRSCPHRDPTAPPRRLERVLVTRTSPRRRRDVRRRPERDREDIVRSSGRVGAVRCENENPSGAGTPTRPHDGDG